MKTRAFLFVALCAGALAACSGAGSPVPGGGVPEGPAARPAASTLPIVDGAKYSYQVTTEFNAFPPGANPTPTPHTATFARTMTVKTGLRFQGHSGLTGFVYDEQVAGAPAVTYTNYYGWIPDGTYQGFAYYGQTSAATGGPDPTYSASSTTYDDKPDVVIEVPAAKGHRFEPDYSYTGSGSSRGKAGSETFTAGGASDGTYLYDETNKTSKPKRTTEDATSVHDDGSAAFRFGMTGCSDFTQSFAPPSKNRGKWSIAETYRGPVCPAPSPTPAPVASSIPDWYPGGGAIEHLQTEAVTDLGKTPLPKACAVPSKIATKGEQFRDVFQELDPTTGIYSDVVDQFYADGVGLVCQIDRDTTTVYGTLPYSNPGTPQIVFLDDEVISLRSFSLPAGAAAPRLGFTPVGATANERRRMEMRFAVVRWLALHPLRRSSG